MRTTLSLVFLAATVAASIEGEVRWPTRLLGEDGTLTLTIRGDRRAFRRPELHLLRNNQLIHTRQFLVTNDLPLRLDFHLGCALFKMKGIYEIRVIGTPGTPPVYTTGKKLLDSFPHFELSFLEDQVEALSREIMVVGMFNKRAICHQSESLIVVRMESLDDSTRLEEPFSIYIRFPSDALKIPCSAFSTPGQYRLTASLDGETISKSKPLTVTPSTQYRLQVKSKTISSLRRTELAQCGPDDIDGYFDVEYVSPPCAQRHRLMLESRHQSRKFESTPKYFELSSHSNQLKVKCRDIHHAAHGACLHYLDELGNAQTSVCFALSGRPTPPIDGQWARWGEMRKCSAPCELASLGDATYASGGDLGGGGGAEWSFKQRVCASPAVLGSGTRCNAQTTKVASDSQRRQVEFDVQQESCRNPWQLARQIDAVTESCECGCEKVVDNQQAVAIFSPAPWRCQTDQIIWKLTCTDCDSIIMHVLHLDLDQTEGLFIHENSDERVYRIDSVGSTQHQTTSVTIRYDRPGEQAGCGFGVRLAFAQALAIPMLPAQQRTTDLEEGSSSSASANLGLWGILVCSGFLIILLVASIMNCRSSSSSREDNEERKVEKVYSSTQETDVMLDDSFSRSPQKLKPNAATYSLAQHQLRLMKQGGQVSAVANYPRELFECEKQAKEQIPLLFGLDMSKHQSATSVGSDQAEAAPAHSNRTETTHSTAVSDESNNCRPYNKLRPGSMAFADNESSSSPPSPKFPPPNSRVPSSTDSDHVERV